MIDPMYAWKLEVPAEAMVLTLQYLYEVFRSVENYLSTIGLAAEQIDRLRAKMLD